MSESEEDATELWSNDGDNLDNCVAENDDYLTRDSSIHVVLAFLILWQIAFRISNAAVTAILLFFLKILPHIDERTARMSSSMPSTYNSLTKS